MKLRFANIILLLLFCMCSAGIVSAESTNNLPARRITPPEASQDRESDISGTPLNGSSIGTTIAALGAILLLFLGLVQVWRKYTPQANQSLPESAWQILGTVPLNQKHQLCVVRIGSRLLVLGQSEQGLQTLSEITNGEEVAQLMALCQTPPKNSDNVSFGDLLSKFRDRSESFSVSSSEEAKRA
ncbi:MAG: flagellar biosynthetic protein FliO [Planctomycetaceae bacterium]|nr:flagellar biosynthetic protein FliO [Planctomycetaceae bacterium]